MKPSKFLKPCGKCGTEFWAIPSKVAEGKDKYCSKECYRQTLIGRRLSPATEFTSKRMSGENNPRWAGDNISYGGLHDWVYLRLGHPQVCSHCGEKNKKLHWANRSRTYKRDLSDWISLCVSCHKKYDLEAIKKDRAQHENRL